MLNSKVISKLTFSSLLLSGILPCIALLFVFTASGSALANAKCAELISLCVGEAERIGEGAKEIKACKPLKTCKRSICRQGKRDTKSECRAKRAACFKGCKDFPGIKKNCRPFCRSQKRACFAAARSEKRECFSDCRETYLTPACTKARKKLGSSVLLTIPKCAALLACLKSGS